MKIWTTDPADLSVVTIRVPSLRYIVGYLARRKLARAMCRAESWWFGWCRHCERAS